VTVTFRVASFTTSIFLDGDTGVVREDFLGVGEAPRRRT